MAAVTTTINSYLNSDALFRLWGKAISDQMLAGSWVKTTDTGQIDWATITRAASNTAAGYEIWRSNDAGGGLNEIYVKIEYGSGTSNVFASNWLTVGWGSNGSGTLTGVTTTRTQMSSNNWNDALHTTYLSVSAGRFCFAVFNSTSVSAYLISLERTLSNSLALQNEILVMYQSLAGGFSYRQVLNQGTGAYPAVTSAGIASAVVDSNSLQSGNAGLGLVFGQRGGFTNPSANIIGCYGTNLGSPGTQISVDTYGSAINYMVLAIHNIDAAGTNKLLMRYE